MGAREAGSAELAFAVHAGRSVAEHVRRSGIMRVSPRLPAGGGAAYHLVMTTGGGLLEGERCRTDVLLGPGAHAVLATQAPTYAYKCLHGVASEQCVRAELGEGSLLELYADEVIPYRDARFSQLTEIDLAPRSALVLTDGLTSGWSADGRPFAFRSATLRTRVRVDGELVLNDCLLCAPERQDAARLGLFEGYGAYLSCVVVDEAVGRGFVEEARARLGGEAWGVRVRWGVSALERGGAVLRVLCDEVQRGRRVLRCFAGYYREQVKGCAPLALRKNDEPACGGDAGGFLQKK